MSAAGPSEGAKAPAGAGALHEVTSVGTRMKAVDLHAKPSPDFGAKLFETGSLLRRAAAEFAPLTQASSLGAEDVVITQAP